MGSFAIGHAGGVCEIAGFPPSIASFNESEFFNCANLADCQPDPFVIKSDLSQSLIELVRLQHAQAYPFFDDRRFSGRR